MFLIRSFSKCSILRLRHVGLANYTGSRSILWTYRLSPSVCSQLGACIAISLQTVCRNARTTHLMLVASIKTFVFYLINLIIVTAVTACFLGQFCGVLFSCPVSPPPSFSLTCSLPVCVLVGVVSATERRTCDSASHQLSPHKPGLLFAQVPDCSILNQCISSVVSSIISCVFDLGCDFFMSLFDAI